MKLVSILFFLSTVFSFSQQKTLKSFWSDKKKVEIITDGLDDIIIENTTSNSFEVLLDNDNSFPVRVNLKEEGSRLLISFEKIAPVDLEIAIFRKYITTRLERVRVTIKIPRNKELYIIGETIGVISQSYQGDLKVFIDKGNIKLGSLKGNAEIKLFLGNVYATADGSFSINAATNNGEIEIDGKVYLKKHQFKAFEKAKKLTFESVNANIFITKQ